MRTRTHTRAESDAPYAADPEAYFGFSSAPLRVLDPGCSVYMPSRRSSSHCVESL
jgi:hypothetical protein